MKPYYADKHTIIYNCDYQKIVRSGVNLVLTDPPYGLSDPDGEREIKVSDRTFNKYFGDWDHSFNVADFLVWAEKLLLPGGALVAFMCHDQIGAYQKTPLIERKFGVWTKPNPAPNVRPNYQSATEFWQWQVKSGKTPTWNGGHVQSNVIHLPLCAGNERTAHPTQKPLKLMNGFIKRHSNKDDIVFDPFMGSGTTLVAAKALGRRAIGCEISKEYCDLAVLRLKQEVLDFGC